MDGQSCKPYTKDVETNAKTTHTKTQRTQGGPLLQAIRYWLTVELAPECHMKLLRVTTRISRNVCAKSIRGSECT